MNKWHIVRTLNFLISLPSVPEYDLFYTRLWPTKSKYARAAIDRVVWRKDRFRVRLKNSRFYNWYDLEPEEWIEDSFGRVLLRGSDYKGKANNDFVSERQ
jgi:hypothetical protein